ncbi:hypothetical protein IFM89_011396 [Coptis chinensis]|uniref:LysM domain-containing protein n=1 Tax=Coptis chinensis TaxID=261450 RepID=A0A835HZ38_9MAGN|nr:hypothetical protein IFM89_011396 [Coptis chinensis]
MAKINNKAAMFNIVFMLSLLLIVSMADGRGKTLQCDKVVGVQGGDTCLGIIQSSNSTTATFVAINPNLNCSALFVGQWLCVSATFN